MRLDSRASISCHEWLHKKHAPNSFPGLVPDPENAVAEEFKEQGKIHELKVIEGLKVHFKNLVQVDINASREEQQLQTADALLAPESEVIVGADIGEICEAEIGRKLGVVLSDSPRASRPDLLIKLGSDSADKPFWAPVDIKSHKALDATKSNKAWLSTLPNFSPADGEEIGGKFETEDLHQLAHYSRHLQTLGLASPGLWTGIIGRDLETIAWSKISEVVLGVGAKQTLALTQYDQEFEIAFDLVRAAMTENQNPLQASGIIAENMPGKMGCTLCEYKLTCLSEMENYPGGGHITLLASVTPKIVAKSMPGIKSIDELLQATPINDDMIKSQIRGRVWKSQVPEILDPSSPLDLPEFDIEIDIDLENSMEALRELEISEPIGEDRLYLYGYGILDRTVSKDWRKAKIETVSDYSNTDVGEYEIMLTVWEKLQSEVAKAEAAGKSIGIFHYSPHERTWWNKFAKKYQGQAGVPSEAEVLNFTTQYFVDLLTYTRKISFPTMGYSIKLLAKVANFSWAVKDPGGAGSLLKYKTATSKVASKQEQEEANAWLDSYNRDDVRATFAVREYVRSLKF